MPLPLECSRTRIFDPSNAIANLACEQQLEVALVVDYTFSGFSFAVSALCIYHLITRFKNRLAHYVILTFTFLLVAANIISLVLVTQSYHTYLHFMLAAASVTPDGNSTFPGPTVAQLTHIVEERAFAQDLYLPIFFWVTDAFLLYRAWVIWQGRRWALIAPYFLFFASLVSGIICQALFARTKFFETPWVPALSFSSAVDLITTGMIGGRLYYHHRRQRRLGFTDSRFFVSALVICVESGLMSTVSKLLQFAIPLSDRALSVVPLVTIASNLIVLRKALDLDIRAFVGRDTRTTLTDIRFGSNQQNITSGAGSTVLDTVRSPTSAEVGNRTHYGRTRANTGATMATMSEESFLDIRGEAEKKSPVLEPGEAV